jgi:plastocyanin
MVDEPCLALHEAKKEPPSTRVRLRLVLGGLAIAGVFGIMDIGGVARGGATVLVSQKGRAFHPGSLSIGAGDTVTVVNDDGDLLHHAYVESADFSFDSGDQQPGSRVDITFNKPGTFNVLCGIHPKMKVVVTVHP